MKITASYISSNYETRQTIEMLDKCQNIDSIHVDLMDGKYVLNNNLNIDELPNLFTNINKKLDVHLMVEEPEQYIDDLFKLNTNIIFFHPSTTKDPSGLINIIKDNNKKAGIVINPDENIKDFKEYFDEVDAILIMSVVPGKGGQTFLRDTLVSYELLKVEKKQYNFMIYIDGGINEETVKFVKEADGVIAGSFICKSDDFEKQISKLIK